MKPRAFLLLAIVAVGAGSECRVGTGVGAADGALYVRQCTVEADYGSPAMPKPYRLDPQFFAGEPLEDLKKDGPDNRLIIRLQRSGKRIEVNDLLTFDIVDMYTVARCVAGIDRDTKSCWWGPNLTGPPRVRIGIDFPIRSNFVPRTTCPYDMGRHAPAAIGAYLVATAMADDLNGLGLTPDPPIHTKAGGWDSWIEFAQFGSASPEGGAPCLDPKVELPCLDFKVEFGERLHASRFHLTLTDDRVLKAAHLLQPLPRSDISGLLDGYFDFDLERGQGAQTFP
jgi:hypothetical protein